jgi:chromosome segregation ATPase
MKTMRYAIILFLLARIFVVDVIASFEQFVYEDNPSEVIENFNNAFQVADSSNSFDKQEESEDVADFIVHKKEADSIGKLETGFEAEKIAKTNMVSHDFQSTGPEVEDRILTDIQKNSQKILEERLKEDSRKQHMLAILQEQEYLKMQQKVWKTFKEKADGIRPKRYFSPEKEQKAVQTQSLLQQLQSSKNALLEKDKQANELADKLAKINAQRITIAQRLQVQKAARRSLSDAVNSKTQQGKAQFMQARNQEQINSEQFIRLDKQFNIVNSQLQDVRNQAQIMRGQFQEIQQAIERQLPQTSGKEEAY